MNDYSIEGLVVDSDGEPLPVEPGVCEVVPELMTAGSQNSAGYFVGPDSQFAVTVGRGTYDLTVYCPDHEGKVTGIVVDSGHVRGVQITMTPMPRPTVSSEASAPSAQTGSPQRCGGPAPAPRPLSSVTSLGVPVSATLCVYEFEGPARSVKVDGAEMLAILQDRWSQRGEPGSCGLAELTPPIAVLFAHADGSRSHVLIDVPCASIWLPRGSVILSDASNDYLVDLSMRAR